MNVRNQSMIRTFVLKYCGKRSNLALLTALFSTSFIGR